MLNSFGDQILREIPNFVGSDDDAESPLSFQVWGAVDTYENYEPISLPGEYGRSTCFRRFTDDTYGIHIKEVLLGFVVYNSPDVDILVQKHHMAPPFQSKCVTEFLAMAGVEWH
jgi:hypothetical protein